MIVVTTALGLNKKADILQMLDDFQLKFQFFFFILIKISSEFVSRVQLDVTRYG